MKKLIYSLSAFRPSWCYISLEWLLFCWFACQTVKPVTKIDSVHDLLGILQCKIWTYHQPHESHINWFMTWTRTRSKLNQSRIWQYDWRFSIIKWNSFGSINHIPLLKIPDDFNMWFGLKWLYSKLTSWNGMFHEYFIVIILKVARLYCIPGKRFFKCILFSFFFFSFHHRLNKQTVIASFD